MTMCLQTASVVPLKCPEDAVIQFTSKTIFKISLTASTNVELQV